MLEVEALVETLMVLVAGALVALVALGLLVLLAPRDYLETPEPPEPPEPPARPDHQAPQENLEILEDHLGRTTIRGTGTRRGRTILTIPAKDKEKDG